MKVISVFLETKGGEGFKKNELSGVAKGSKIISNVAFDSRSVYPAWITYEY
jgi:hypothetical protein